MGAASILALVAISGQVIKLCVETAGGIHNLHGRQKEAHASLIEIRHECTTLAAGVESIKAWAGTSAARRREKQCVSLEVALRGFTPSLQRVSNDVEQMLKYTRKDGKLTTKNSLARI
jgi:hypothetical protein